MKHKILVADDDENIRITLQRVFSDCDSLSAADGKIALELISAEKPCLVFLDITMPGLSGLEVLEAVKELDDKPAIFMLTGDGELETAVKALDKGARTYITKPFDVREIRKIAQIVFDEKESGCKTRDLPWKLKE
ncbi:MAG: two-component system response regulator [Elusimicrobia bacterium CG08_land_8_20_14_0_20_51_18]|nr:MAG: two-component system response regulator [Elusimicrobia bacterium CG08_land_8_20_14_0_20_51_18]